MKSGLTILSLFLALTASPVASWSLSSSSTTRNVHTAGRGLLASTTRRGTSTHSSTHLVQSSIAGIHVGNRDSPSSLLKQTVKRTCQGYMHCCKTRPFLTKAWTAAGIMAVGDFLAQHLEATLRGSSLSQLNWIRLGAFILTGFFYKGPFLHTWYGQLTKLASWVEKRFEWSKKSQLWTKILVDQSVGAATFFVLYFYVYEFMEAFMMMRVPLMGKATAKLMKQFVPVMIAQYHIWPLVSYANFRHVPPQLQVLVSSVVAIFWNAFLCTRLAV